MGIYFGKFSASFKIKSKHNFKAAQKYFNLNKLAILAFAKLSLMFVVNFITVIKKCSYECIRIIKCNL